MSSQPLSITDFAAKIKAKYPEYAEVNDDELVNRIIAKHPDYAPMVNMNAGTPITDTSVMRAATPEEVQQAKSEEQQRIDADKPLNQAIQWGTNLALDSYKAGQGDIRAALSIPERLTRPLMNIIRRVYDPTNALGGSVLNLERNRPMASDKEAAEVMDLISETMLMPGVWDAMKAKLPASIIEAITLSGESGTTARRIPKMTYAEAKQIKRDMPILRNQVAQEVGDVRSGLQANKAQELDAVEQAREINEQSLVSPIEKEIQNLQQGRRNVSEMLTEVSADQTVQNRRNIQALRGQKAAQEQALQGRVEKQAEEYRYGFGKPPDKISFGGKFGQATKSRATTYNEIQGIEHETHKGIIDISKRPKNIVTQVTQKPSKVLDEAGRPIMETVEKEIPGMIDTAELRASLASKYETMEGEIQVAANNGSPAARALKQLYESDAPLSLEQALNTRAALNKIGYHDADVAFTDASQAIARDLSNKLGGTIRKQVSQFKDGGDEAIKLMDKEVEVLRYRDSVFGTAEAKAARKTMERYGDATRLTDPVALDAWMYQVDRPTIEAAKSQVADELLREGPQEFSKRWKAMDREVKSLWFSEDQIKRGDEIAGASKEGLAKIAQQYKEAEAARITKAVENSSEITKKKAELTRIQTKIDELRNKASTISGTEKNQLNFERKKIEANYRRKNDELRHAVSMKKQQLIRKEQEAQDKIDKVKKYKRLGWIALAAGVGSYASGVFRGVKSALMGE